MRFARHLIAADIAALVYLFGASAVFATQWTSGPDYRAAIVLNLLFAVGIIVSAGGAAASHRSRFCRFVCVARRFYPLLFVGLAYVQVGLFATIIYGAGVTFDPLLAAWDAGLFGTSPHTWMHEILPGRIWAETMHLLYVLFYPILFCGFLYVLLRRTEEYPRFAFIFLGAFLSFLAVYIMLPASGPLSYREGLFPRTVVFSQLVDFLYTFGIPSVGGAFPSSHVGLSVTLLLLLRPLTAGMKVLILFVTAGIAVSMVYASVHYAIDALTGIPAGFLLHYVWDRLYRCWGARRDAQIGGTDQPWSTSGVASGRAKFMHSGR